MKRFSLIELLVVVAIIGMLSVLILPALGQAMKKAQSSVCKNNLKQLALALEMYVDDNGDYYPYAENDDDVS